jgi:hypothetical protein
MARAEEQTNEDIKSLCFFVETTLHLNPTRMARETCVAYQHVVDRVRADLVAREVGTGPARGFAELYKGVRDENEG